jgi:hypothetical protein
MIHNDPNSDPNRPFGYDSRRLAVNDSTLGAFIALVAIFALAFLGIYFFSPQSDGTHTARNPPTTTIPTPPASSPGPIK